jgi:hypothetical protein
MRPSDGERQASVTCRYEIGLYGNDITVAIRNDSALPIVESAGRAAVVLVLNKHRGITSIGKLLNEY